MSAEFGHLQLMTIPQVADVLQVSRSWVYGAINDGVLPAHRVGRSLRIRRESVAAFLDENRVRPAGPPQEKYLDPDALIARIRAERKSDRGRPRTR